MEPVDDLEYVVRMLADCNAEAVANAVGLSGKTVRAIANRSNTNPTFHTVRILAEHFRKKTEAAKKP